MKVFLALFLAVIFMPLSNAWEISVDVKIKELVQWEGSGNFLIILTDEKRCFGPLVDKELYSLVLALHLAGRSLTTYCHDAAQSFNGYQGVHKLHRVDVPQ